MVLFGKVYCVGVECGDLVVVEVGGDGKGRLAAVEILKSTPRTREYIEKGESDGKSLLCAIS